MIRRFLVALSLLWIGASSPAVAEEPAAADPTVEELLDGTDDVMRGASSRGLMTMRVKTSRYERTVTMRVTTQGEEKSLIVLEDPPKEKGVATLKVGENIWNYLPKVDRTMKVPSSMMGGSWMGSHFSNNDLVKENRLADEYTASITAKPDTDPDKNYVIELIPTPDAPVVWGKLVVRVSADLLPKSITYYDEKGEVARTMTYEEVQDFDGRKIPAVMRIVPGDKPEEFTEVRIKEFEFDVELPDTTFSLQALRR